MSPRQRTEINLLRRSGSNANLQREHRVPFLPLHLDPSSPEQWTINLILWRERSIHRQGRYVDLTRIVDFASLTFDPRVAIPESEVLSTFTKDLFG